jgi:hypothetical protein
LGGAFFLVFFLLRTLDFFAICGCYHGKIFLTIDRRILGEQFILTKARVDLRANSRQVVDCTLNGGLIWRNRHVFDGSGDGILDRNFVTTVIGNRVE